MAKRKNPPRRRDRIQKKRPCFFCQEKKEPNLKELEMLRRMVSERGKIVSRGKTGVCQKHQRKLGVAIKRARFLALLPFVVEVR